MDIDPSKLLAEARQEPVRPRVADFAEAMRELRAKGFTFRQIAEWLSQRGLDVDHNAVYRVLGAAERGAGSNRAAASRPTRQRPPPAPALGPSDDESPIPL